MVVHLNLRLRTRSTAMEVVEPCTPQPLTLAPSSAVEPYIPQPWTLAPSSSIDKPNMSAAMESVLMQVVSFARGASLDVYGMVAILVQALVEDKFLLWWVSVASHPFLFDICETSTPSWEANFAHVSFLALRAVVFTLAAPVMGHPC